MLDRIIFGDNQFFGINHMSEEKAHALAERFCSLKAITDVIDTAYDSGVNAFMLNTNERANEICDYLRRNRSRYENLVLYPSMPYAYKYATAVNEKGIFAAIMLGLYPDLKPEERVKKLVDHAEWGINEIAHQNDIGTLDFYSYVADIEKRM